MPAKPPSLPVSSVPPNAVLTAIIQLMLIQKTNRNDRCADCSAPSPQWASPKFGIFICLTCAGTHRGLGVHISFVRSISMDAFKTNEILRMEKGGNEPWKAFFNGHEATQMEGRTFEECTIAERYSGEVGEEWKERLTAAAEGKEYVKGERKVAEPVRSRTQTPVGSRMQGIGSQGNNTRSASPAVMGGRKVQNEAYFAKMGAANADRDASLPPSQGGKYAGFGSEPMPSSRQGPGGGNIPGVNDFQQDPVAALTKGFGWFASAVGKSAKTVHEGYIAPAAKQLGESDFAAQARLAAAQAGKGIQTGAKTAGDSFSRFVEGEEGGRPGPGGARRADPERKDFWDSFGAPPAGEGPAAKPTSIGTSAMKKGTGSGGFGGGSSAKDEEEWGDKW